MKDNKFNYYNKIKNWDFSQINCEIESLTNWDISKILNEKATKKSRILDLGTGGGEVVINEFPVALEIVGTDFSPEMIKTANNNLKKSNKKNIKFRIMDNLNMDTDDNYFDIVVFSEGHENNNLKEDNIDMQILNRYIENNTTNRGILLRRRYYGIIANK